MYFVQYFVVLVRERVNDDKSLQAIECLLRNSRRKFEYNIIYLVCRSQPLSHVHTSVEYNYHSRTMT